MTAAFLDTNVIVRYITGLPPNMASRAAEIIDRLDDLWVTPVAIAEAAYILTTVYQLPREHVVDHLMEFLLKENIYSYAIDQGLLLQGLLLCRPSGRISIPDSLIWASARSAGAQIVYSFDERFPDLGLEVRRGEG